jgi:alkyl sulfatase BDS1-like metallo-beta-lactamase superfamily hydrolase
VSERDFEEARRGLIAEFDPPVVEDSRGRVVWDLRALTTSSTASRQTPPTRTSGGKAG